MPEFKVEPLRVVTRPIIKLEEAKPRYLLLEKPMFLGKEIKKSRRNESEPDAKKKEPATLLFATDLESGEVGQVIVNTVLKGILTEEYPEDTYVGKCFEITKNSRAAGRDYNTFKVIEIKDPRPAEKATPPAAAEHGSNKRK